MLKTRTIPLLADDADHTRLYPFDLRTKRPSSNLEKHTRFGTMRILVSNDGPVDARIRVHAMMIRIVHVGYCVAKLK